MSNALVCIKRVPDLGGEISLTPDGMSVDDRSLGHTVSPHEECAVELAIQVAKEKRNRGKVVCKSAALSLAPAKTGSFEVE